MNCELLIIFYEKHAKASETKRENSKWRVMYITTNETTMTENAVWHFLEATEGISRLGAICSKGHLPCHTSDPLSGIPTTKSTWPITKGSQLWNQTWRNIPSHSLSSHSRWHHKSTNPSTSDANAQTPVSAILWWTNRQADWPSLMHRRKSTLID
jgi:hypothetical protein